VGGRRVWRASVSGGEGGVMRKRRSGTRGVAEATVVVLVVVVVDRGFMAQWTTRGGKR